MSRVPEGRDETAPRGSRPGRTGGAPGALFALLVLAPLAGAAEAQVDRAGDLFTEVEGGLPADASPGLGNAAETPEVRTMRGRRVRVAFEQLAAARAGAVAAGAGAALTLNLFDDVRLTAVVERAGPTASGTGYALSGRIDGEPGAVTLVVYGETVAGTVTASAGTFTIQPLGDGVHAVSQVDTSALPPPGEPLSPPPAPETPKDGPPPAAASPPATGAAEDGVSTIDVAVFYTAAARDGAVTVTGVAGITGLVDLMFENANAAYQSSGVMQRIRLVSLAEVAYVESGESGTDLDRLTRRGDGIMDEVHGIRDDFGADLVHLVSDPEDVCGIAWFNPGESHAFGLTGYDCEVGGYTFAHELGHNMGLNHDRYTEWCADAEERPGGCDIVLENTPHAYSYGYVNQRALAADATEDQAWTTIMAYSWQCGDAELSCRTLRDFSNPGNSLGGDPLGVPGAAPSQEVDGPADAVRALNETRAVVAAFRETSMPPAGPDLVVRSPAASELSLTPGQAFTFSATVRNRGEAEAPATTLAFRGRPEGGAWAELGSEPVGPLAPFVSSPVSLGLRASAAEGIHEYSACVSPFDGESLTDNNCSGLVWVVVSADGTAGECTNDLGPVSGTVTRRGVWTGDCLSVHYSFGEYARYYTFTLGGDAPVTMDLTSPSVDTWLALRNGTGTGVGLVEFDDDGGVGTNARIVRDLAAGTYTIEATTFEGGVTGPFTLTLAVELAPVVGEPIAPGVPVRAVHFTALRSRIDAVRAAAGLRPFPWTDPVLTPLTTPVRAVHLLDLRVALAEAYAGAARPAPRWTDAAVAGTPIRAIHLTELRAAVAALE